MKKSTEQQVLALFAQAMRTALAIIDEKPVKSQRRSASSVAPGIFPAQSKYNPYRAYAWNGEKNVYLGMFPSVAACKRAQREYRAGKQPTAGTRRANHRAPLAVVGRAA
jgi:hypothetical protein